MAATFAPVAGTVGVPHPAGSERRVFQTVTFDSSYATGGYPITAANFGLSTILSLDANTSSAGHGVWFDSVNNKLKVFTTAATEVANAASLAGVTCVIEAVGY